MQIYERTRVSLLLMLVTHLHSNNIELIRYCMKCVESISYRNNSSLMVDIGQGPHFKQQSLLIIIKVISVKTICLLYYFTE